MGVARMGIGVGCRWWRVAMVAVGAVLAAASAAAQGPTGDVPRVTMPRMTAPPAIDGRVGEDEWRGAVRSVGLVGAESGALTARRGVFWVGCDGRMLWLAMKTEAPPDGRILTRAVPEADRDAAMVLLDDAVEVGLALPSPDKSSHAIYRLVFNARGAVLDWIEPAGQDKPAADPKQPIDRAWRLPKWEMKQQVADGWWQVEAAIPLESMGVKGEGFARPWGVQVGRVWQRPAERSRWAVAPSGSGEREAMPLVAIDDTAPVVRVLGLEGDAGQPQVRVGVFNPHSKPLTARVRLSDAWHRDPPQQVDRQVQVAAGNEEVVVLDGRRGGPEGLHQTAIDVTSPDGRSVYYHRAVRWSPERPAGRWTVGEEQKRAVDLQFKYYPYLDKVRIRVGIEALALRGQVTGATVGIVRAAAQPEKGDKSNLPPLWTRPIKFAGYAAEETCEVPKLAEGDYLFTVKLEGGEGLPQGPVVQPFVRRVFEWEHNRLGTSDEVMPPFTPLEVQDRTVRAVLREHRHGDAGLWSSVASDGRPLLAAPMRWEVVTAAPDGSGPQVQPVAGSGWKATSRRPTAVEGEAAWSAGPVKAVVRTTYDYDGMMLVRLELPPVAASLHRLSLVIPLDDARARYMHAVGDGLRSNYAGFTPDGQGAVWDSSKAARTELAGTFFPYLWLGDGERGLCWFADTDRDWVLDDKTPALELVREGKTLNLCVHFITRPGALERKHEIVFGLQATPTKPMPEGWRRWVASKAVEGGRPVGWVGACYYWGGMSYDVYPFERRFDFYDALRLGRQTGKIDQEFIARWMKMVDERLAPKGTDKHEFLLRHVQAGFHSASASRWDRGWRLFGYTNPRGAGFHVPEFATFQDEWLRYRWFHRKWGREGDVGYDVDPVESFQDYCLWHYRKMLACYDGVYWDNLFLSANFDPVAGGAWTDEQGRVHPSLGLLHMRELVKRTAVMLWQEGRDLPEGRRPPITLGHTTNALIVPVMSFLNCTMDWEWKYGYDDFQDRFSPELTVAETIGRQVGAWPTILAGGHPDPKDPRVPFMLRTRLGVALTHELQVFDYQPARDAEVYKKLFEFGYGTEGCRVFNYWQEGHPVGVEGVRACTLALAKGGAAVVVVTDYGGGGTARVTLDRAALGFKAEAAAVDLETGEAIERAAPGVFRFTLKKHDFRILRVQ